MNDYDEISRRGRKLGVTEDDPPGSELHVGVEFDVQDATFHVADRSS